MHIPDHGATNEAVVHKRLQITWETKQNQLRKPLLVDHLHISELDVHVLVDSIQRVYEGANSVLNQKGYVPRSWTSFFSSTVTTACLSFKTLNSETKI